MKYKSLSQIHSKSDKISHHGYHRFYDRFLSPLTDGKIRMLELGYENGYSVDLWKQYFSDVTIHSIDIIENPNNPLVDEYFKVNQDSNKELDLFVNHIVEKYDFIIDDASHVPAHQWNTFTRFMEILKDGGIYIIEDIETSFWGKSEMFGYKFDSSDSSILSKVPIILNFINSEFNETGFDAKYNLALEEIKAIKQIESVFCGYNCLIFIKKNPTHQKYYRINSNYRHNHFINRLKMPSSKNTFFKNLFNKK